MKMVDLTLRDFIAQVDNGQIQDTPSSVLQMCGCDEMDSMNTEMFSLYNDGNLNPSRYPALVVEYLLSIGSESISIQRLNLNGNVNYQGSVAVDNIYMSEIGISELKLDDPTSLGWMIMSQIAGGTTRLCMLFIFEDSIMFYYMT